MQRIIWLFSALLAAVAVIVVFSFPEPDVAGSQSSQSEPAAQAQLIVDLPGRTLEATLSVTAEPLQYELEQLDQRRDDISFSYREFDFGSFVTGINGVEADPNSEYWELLVNDVPSGTGISDLQISPGDTVRFTLQSF